MMNPVLPKHKQKLYEYIRKWQDLLSLHRWRIFPSKLPTKAMAELKFDKDNSHKLVSLLVGNDWKNTPITDESLELTAIHEMIHILLFEYKEAVREEPYNEGRQMEVEHTIVHVLEKLLYELWHQKHVELSQKLSVHRPKKQRA